MDPVEWAKYLVERYSMEPVEIDPNNPMRMVETSMNGFPAVRVILLPTFRSSDSV